MLKFSVWAIVRMELLSIEMGKIAERASLEEEVRGSALDILHLRCLLDIQVELIEERMQRNIWGLCLAERSRLEIHIWEVSAYSCYLKLWD